MEGKLELGSSNYAKYEGLVLLSATHQDFVAMFLESFVLSFVMHVVFHQTVQQLCTGNTFILQNITIQQKSLYCDFSVHSPISDKIRVPLLPIMQY
jgi:hypothetical protein